MWLVMRTKGGDRPFPIHKDRTVIGQEPSTDLRVPMPQVAPRHCEIIRNGAHLELADLGSDQGTLHNGNRVTRVPLNHLDELTIGPVTFFVRMVAGLDDHDGGNDTAVPAPDPSPDPRLPSVEIKPQARAMTRRSTRTPTPD